ncbi:MAG: deoxyribose-phosphate aldolase, partial [Erysipelotrichaceae bacterium]|nr:deoxyribose-phosphate aldolase [Erysipelotrichaceae bacterium]
MTEKELCAMFDHTQLKAYATKVDFEKLCAEARQYGFAMVAVNSYPVKLCKELLKGTSVHVGAAISFPLGQTTIDVKVYETEKAIEDGADEIDYVINVTKAREHDWSYIEEEMKKIVDTCHKHAVLIKVILEICYLSDEEIIEVCKIARKVR